MATTKPELLTADDLLRLYSQGVRGELVLGVLCKNMPAGGQHGEIAFALGGEIRAFVRPRRMGRVAGSDAGVRLSRDPDTVREPDVAYYSAETLPLDVTVTGYYEVAPDLVVEIVSPSDDPRQVYDKAHMWINHGVRMVLEVDPGTRSIRVHRPGEAIVTLTEGDTLDCGEVIPGFGLPVREVFEV